MRRMIFPLCLTAAMLVPSLAFADVAPSGGCNRCSVEDDQTELGLAAFAFAGMLAGAHLLRRRP